MVATAWHVILHGGTTQVSSISPMQCCNGNGFDDRDRMDLTLIGVAFVKDIIEIIVAEIDWFIQDYGINNT